MSKLKFSANLEVLYYELPWAERFAAAKKDGFQYVEFWGWEDKDLEEVKRLVAENGLTLSAMGGDGPFSMCDPANKQEYLDYLKRAIEAAKFVGTDTLIIHSDAPQPSRTTVCIDESCQHAIMNDWSKRFVEAYQDEFQTWVDSCLENGGVPIGSNAWDGFVACAVADKLADAQDTKLMEAVELPERPAFYQA